MDDLHKSQDQVLAELETLRQRNSELEARVTQHEQVEEGLTRFFELPLVMLYIIDMQENKLHRINSEVVRITGRTEEELLSASLLAFVHPEDHEATLKSLARLAEGHPVREFRNRHIRADGEIRTLEWTATPDSEGKFVYAMSRDLTEQIAAEEALKESEHFLRVSQAVAHLGSVYLDIQTQTWISSPATDDVLGIDASYPKNMAGWTDLIHPEDKEETSRYLIEQIMTQHQPFSKEYRIVRPNDGQVRWVQGMGELEFDEQGTPIKIIGTIQDITERRQAEDELRESENRFSVIFNESTDLQILSSVEPDGTFRSAAANKPYAETIKRVFGLSEPEIIGKTLYELTTNVLGLAKTVYDSTAQYYQQAAQTGQPVRYEETLETPQGKFHTEVVIAPIFGASDTCRYILYSARDINERKAAEQQQMELALEKERGETLRTLMGNISHDIKTPLAIINTSLYLLEKHTDPEMRQAKINNIKSQTQILESFVQDLLALSRLDGEPKLQLTLVDMNELAMDIEGEMQPMTEQKHCVLTLDLAEDVPPIQADQTDLRRALTNLVENAIHYAPEGGVVTVRTYRQAECIAVEIMDTGIGISDNDLPHIFDRFYRSPQAKSLINTGSGLGLAIVKRVIEMHGGTIDVETTPGGGSTFRLMLPTKPLLPSS
jgi:PAS domain S-box-containing protein